MPCGERRALPMRAVARSAASSCPTLHRAAPCISLQSASLSGHWRTALQSECGRAHRALLIAEARRAGLRASVLQQDAEDVVLEHGSVDVVVVTLALNCVSDTQVLPEAQFCDGFFFFFFFFFSFSLISPPFGTAKMQVVCLTSFPFFSFLSFWPSSAA